MQQVSLLFLVLFAQNCFFEDSSALTPHLLVLIGDAFIAILV